MCSSDLSAEPLLRALVAGGRLVPVTTRTRAQYERIRLPGGPARLAVCLNGGRVLVEGVEDAVHRAAAARAVAASAPIERAEDLLGTWLGDHAAVLGPGRLRDAERLFLYAVLEAAPDPVAAARALAEVVAAADALGWGVSVQGRKVYLVPQGLTKESALAHLERAHGVRVVAAAGDSLLDQGMIAAAGAGWVPRDSEAERASAVAPGAVVTASSGLAAGAEIVAAIGALLEVPPGVTGS